MSISTLVLAFLASQAYRVNAYNNFTSISDDFVWTSITPTPDLQYHDCGGGFQCARLQLPLDWNSTAGGPTDGEKYNMAIVKLPAQVPVTDIRYGGPVLINPGGPGVSGTEDALESGQLFQQIFDAAFANGSDTYLSPDPSARYFDIIGFDPRAVGNSTPWYSCVEDPLLWNNFMVAGNGLYLDYPNPTNFEAIWERSIALPNSCIWDPVTNPDGARIANFSGTASTARDLVEFAERHGEWREKQASNSTDAATRARLQWKKGEEPILFHGQSYGTLLGATLAAMQPHRVYRFLLDGVTQGPEYYAGNLTSDAQQGDALMDKFFEYCALVGPDYCSLWAGNSTADTRNRVQNILDDLRETPVPVPGNDDIGPDVITLGDVRQLFDLLLEAPLNSWPQVADALAPLTDRNGTLIAGIKQDSVDVEWDDLEELDQDDPSTAYPFNDATQFFYLTWLWVIEGGETAARFTKQEFTDILWAPLHNLTYWYGDYDATIYQFFATWPIKYKWIYGDDHDIASNVTANPVLFASNLIDAETSLESAQFMTAAFKGSGLIVVDGEGHLASAEPSLCYAKAVRYYFQTGKLPDTSQHCLPLQRPFRGADMPNTEKPGNLTREEQFLLDSIVAYSLSYDT